MTLRQRQPMTSETALIGAAIGTMSAVAAASLMYLFAQRASKDEELTYWNKARAAMLDASLQMLQLPVEMRARIRAHKGVTDDDTLWFATAASSTMMDLGRAHSVMMVVGEYDSLRATATELFNAAEAVQSLDPGALDGALTDAERVLKATRQVLLAEIDEL